MEHLAKRGQRPVCPPAGVIDLHCDTLTRDQWEEDSGGDTLDNPGYHLSLGGLPAGRFWVQCFAIFVPDQLRGREAIGFFDRYHASFCRQMEANRDRILPCRSFLDLERARAQGKNAAILTVEGGAVLAGQLERVRAIREAGVPAFLSYSAGTFVCNDILYSLLHLAAGDYPAMKGGFLHVPYATEQTVDKPSGTPGMELGTIARALERAIGAVVEAIAEGVPEKQDK